MAVNGKRPARDLSTLATELRDIAEELERPPLPDLARIAPHQASIVDVILAAGRARAVVFGELEELFGDPAWSILLNLYSAEAMRRTISVSAAGLCSGAPQTTGQRYVAMLEDKGLLRRFRDDTDGRRQLVSLTDAAIALIEQWLARLRSVPQATA